MKSRSQTIAVLCIFVALVVLFLLFTLWASIWVDPTLGPMRPHSLKADQVAHAGNLGSLLQGTLGVATGLAGAVVAVTIALLAYRIAENEKYREDFRFVNERLEKAMLPIIYLARALSSLYALMIVGHETKMKLINQAPFIGEGEDRHLDSEAPIGVYLYYKEALSEQAVKLAEALESILLDSVSSKIFISIARDRREKGRLFSLPVLGCHKIDEAFADTAHILRIWAKDMAQGSDDAAWGNIGASVGAANFMKDGKGEEFDHLGVRSFLELGYELRMPTTTDDGHIDHSGPGMLFNLAQCIPQGISDIESPLQEVFEEALTRKLKEQSPLLAFFRSENRSLWLGPSISTAIEWIAANGLEPLTFEKEQATYRRRRWLRLRRDLP